MQHLDLNHKQKVMICTAWNGTLPKNSPQWIKDLPANAIWQQTEVSGLQLLELFNSGIDVMMSRTSEGNVLIGLNEQGWKFSQR